MQPQNPNQNQNPYPGQPQQPGQPNPAPFQRRPIQQPIAPRPFAAPSTPAQQPQQQFQPQPQPARPTAAPQFPNNTSPDGFVRPQQPAQPQQFTNHQPQPLQRPAAPQPQPSVQNFAPRPVPGQRQPLQDDAQIDSIINSIERPEKTQPIQTKKRPPIAPLVIIAFGLIGLVVGLLDKSQHNMVFNVFMAVNLLLAVGLLLRKELVRKVTMGFAVATVTISAALVLSYRGLTQSTVKAEANFITEAKKLQNQSPTKQLTHEQQQHLDAMQLRLEAQQEAIGENSALVYGKYGAAVVAYGLVALYLTRSKTKEAFVKVKE